MHHSARRQMALCLETHLDPARSYRMVEVGSAISRTQTKTHRDLLEPYRVRYIGVDIKSGPNVDRVMPNPYTIPVPSRSVDIVISGQTFEHIPFPWATAMEIRRILVPGGLLIVTAPSRGNRHDVYDCWRYYPDAVRALAAWSNLEVLEAYTDFPPIRSDSQVRHHYARITQSHYWGDTVGVLRKPSGRTSLRTRTFSALVRLWANRHADLERVPLPPVPAGRL
ncbi:Methyltransferase type 11 [Beutenbergia cavernae DSM 12333]|uniref:Methyltransferase type 11 n=1 Tax=Beutenbergia cavernae (strain ATCC BAA-8 / DSM 12333 / CCUG 43141 / JCM 11478 / NBRC 16432 / NCIMB 13614 / HKI 0122) TaxID=471853 RepID=C5C160_BEUC1|nr:methyltransferase domain-containing protein [Beutenbergia cavernae]ACQ79464.1 Methyltransferase type 11 [Beutenbergia cavernae DSM 12333]